MKTPLLFALMLIWSVCHAATARAGNQTLIQFDSLRQSLIAGYALDGFSTSVPGEPTKKTTRHTFSERYNVGFNYDIYSPRLLQGTMSLGLMGDQNAEKRGLKKQEDSGSTLDYSIRGSMFKAKPFPMGFSLDSNIFRVNPAFSRSYDMSVDSYGADFRLKNSQLPIHLSLSKNVRESSGLTQDSRDTSSTWALSVERLAPNNSTAVAVNTTDSTITPIGDADFAESSFSTIGASVSNRLRFSSNPKLVRDCLSTLNFSKNGGVDPSSLTDWKESLNWALGKAFLVRLGGGVNVAKNRGATKQERQVMAALEQGIGNSITTRIFSDLRQTVLDSGSESETRAGASLDYRSRISDNVDLAAGYSYNYGIIDSEFGEDSVFFADERLNVSPLETENYLGRNDIIPGTIVLWSVGRTKVYIRNVDYTVVADGRRTRIRIEPGSSILIGDQVLIEYSVEVNRQVKRDSVVRAAAVSLGLWQRYRISASWGVSRQSELSGQADRVPLPQSENGSVFFERNSPSNTLGTSYVWSDSDSSAYKKYEGYWKFRQELGGANVELNLRDSHTVFSETGAGATISPGGTSNVFQADASCRKTLSEKANLGISGSYKKVNGRSTDQELYSTWLQARFRALQLETTLNLRYDWRLYHAYTQRDFSLRLLVKRNF